MWLVSFFQDPSNDRMLILPSWALSMQVIVQFDGNYLIPFKIRSGVKQGCVLAPTLFGIFIFY